MLAENFPLPGLSFNNEDHLLYLEAGDITHLITETDGNSKDVKIAFDFF